MNKLKKKTFLQDNYNYPKILYMIWEITEKGKYKLYKKQINNNDNNKKKT